MLWECSVAAGANVVSFRACEARAWTLASLRTRPVDFTPLRKHTVTLHLWSQIKPKNDGGQVLFVCKYYSYNKLPTKLSRDRSRCKWFLSSQGFDSLEVSRRAVYTTDDYTHMCSRRLSTGSFNVQSNKIVKICTPTPQVYWCSVHT